MQDLYFEDFTVGRTFSTPGYTLTEADVIGFGLAYDPQRFHIDAEAARASPFGGLIASGFHTLAVTFRLFTMTNAIAAGSMGGGGLDEVRWHMPVRPGDTLRVQVEVIEQRASRSKPDRGSVRLRFNTYNARGQLVQSFVGNVILARRDPSVAV